MHQRHPQFHRRQSIVGMTANIFWQPSIGMKKLQLAMSRQVADMLCHPVWSRGTVESNMSMG